MTFVALRCFVMLALIGLPSIAPERQVDGPRAGLKLLDLEQLEKGLPRGWQLDIKAGSVAVVAEGAEAAEEGSWVRVVGEGEERALQMRCAKASFSLNRDLAGLDQKGRSHLAWDWLATELPAGGDMRVDARNDQALQVLVKFDTSRKRVISYVWDTSAPEGAERSETYALGLYTVKVVCVQSGAEGRNTWVPEQRDLRADYERLFGGEYPGVAGIRIQSNSQHTKSVGAGSVRRLTLGAPAAASPQ